MNPEEIELEEHEFICDKCSGFGLIDNRSNKQIYYNSLVCPKCQGDGKVDWVENAVGKKPKEDYEQMADSLAKNIDKKIIEDLCRAETEEEEVKAETLTLDSMLKSIEDFKRRGIF